MLHGTIAQHLSEQFPAFSVTHTSPRSNIVTNFICVQADTESLLNDLPGTAAISIISNGIAFSDLRSAMYSLRNLHIGETYFQWTRYIGSSSVSIPVAGGQPISCLQSSWSSLCDGA